MRHNRNVIWFATVAMAMLLAGPALLKADDFKIDPVHSSASFLVHHLDAGYVLGVFPLPTGTFTSDAGDAGKTALDVTIDIAKLETFAEQRNNHLKSPDFFDAKQFPTATFKSTKAEKGDDDKHVKVTGDLTIHGVTKSITVTLENTGTGAGMKPGEIRQGWLAQFTIDRKDFGITFMAGKVGDDIRMTVALEGIKQ